MTATQETGDTKGVEASPGDSLGSSVDSSIVHVPEVCWTCMNAGSLQDAPCWACKAHEYGERPYEEWCVMVVSIMQRRGTMATPARTPAPRSEASNANSMFDYEELDREMAYEQL